MYIPQKYVIFVVCLANFISVVNEIRDKFILLLFDVRFSH